MKYKQLLEGLYNYVNGQDQFAIMIDGPWGIGKTYFLKNIFIPDIRRKEEGRKVVYFSVYGYESLIRLKSDLIGDLFISSLGKGLDKTDTLSKVEDIVSLTKGTMNIIGDKLAAFKSLANTAESLIIKKQLKLQKNNSAPILIIDDLERISREINTSDFMGFLLTEIIEPYGYRVIIVGNSQEIRKDDLTEFNLTREKIISRTFPFIYELENIKEEFFKNSNIDFLRDNSDWLEEILNEYVRHNDEQLNLRTIEFIVTTFKIIDNEFKDYLKRNSSKRQYANEIQRSIFANLFVIATEYREGRLTRDNLSVVDQLLDTRNFLFMHMKDDEKKSMAEEITIKYHDESLKQVIMYDSSVNDAIFNGVFNVQKFIEAWIQLFKSQKAISTLDRIANFRDMTDEQLKEVELQLLQDVKGSEVAVGDILSTINDFLFFDQNNLYFGDEEYLPDLLTSLRNAVDKSLLNNDLLYDNSDIAFRYSVLAEDKGVLKQVEGILKSAEIRKDEMDSNHLVNAIFNNDSDMIRNITQSNLKINIFRAILDSNYLVEYLLTPKSKARLLNRYLYSEYIRISNSKDFHSGESQDILELSKKIEGFLKDEGTNIGRIDIFNLNSLLKTLKDIISKFKE